MPADDVALHPRVVVSNGVAIGTRVIAHAGAVLGADGVGYAFDGRACRKIPKVGGLRIEDDVEIGANTTIDLGDPRRDAHTAREQDRQPRAGRA